MNAKLEELYKFTRRHERAIQLLTNVITMITILPEGNAKDIVVKEMMDKYHRHANNLEVSEQSETQ